MSKAGLTPKVPYPGVNIPWECVCNYCHRSTSPTLYWARRATRSACKWCAGVELIPEDAVEIMRQAGWEPLTVYPGVIQPWPSQHQICGQVRYPALDSIKNADRVSCSFCAGNQTFTHETASELLRLAPPYGAVPLEPYRNARTAWRGRCLRCRCEVSPRLDNVTNGSQGVCQGCARSGFDGTAPAIIYLVLHQGHGAAKVGICNEYTSRLQDHRRHGWTIHEVLHLPGFQARMTERAVLDLWRELGRKPALTIADMPQGGWTETVRIQGTSPAALWEQITRAADAARTAALKAVGEEVESETVDIAITLS
jgi:hypothetical protein